MPIGLGGPIKLPPNSTAEEYKEAMEKRLSNWNWSHAENLEDRKSYRIGIDKDSTIKEWFEGSKEELLRKPLAERTDEKMNKEPIPFNVTQPAEFTMERPDAGDSL
ncbi:hypothetical protein IL306_005504, partial [Fusarium sp. DS 682]